MPKIIIQAGHEARTSGSTGAPGEQAFNKDVADQLAAKLEAKGFEVRRVVADPTDAQIAGDWDLFLTIHYDADVYNAPGGFVDFPEPSSDGATAKSQAIARAIESKYFAITGIDNVPSRSNNNTRWYYMWKRVSTKTPCVIIECGVGKRVPKDADLLQSDAGRKLVVKGIYEGILKAFNMESEENMADMYELPSGNQIDLANRESNIATAKTWDEVVHLQKYALKTEVDSQINQARVEERDSTTGKLSDKLAEALGMTKGQNFDRYVESVKVLVLESNSDSGDSGTPVDELPTTFKGKRVTGIIIQP